VQEGVVVMGVKGDQGYMAARGQRGVMYMATSSCHVSLGVEVAPLLALAILLVVESLVSHQYCDSHVFGNMTLYFVRTQASEYLCNSDATTELLCPLSKTREKVVSLFISAGNRDIA
jgi:hypothetical protein